MALSPSEVWARLLSQARTELPEQAIQTWLEPARAAEIAGNALLVEAPDQFAAEWNEAKHSELLTRLAPTALGYPIEVHFRVNPEQQRRPQMDLFVSPASKSAGVPQGQGHRPSLNARYRFSSFIIGKSNELASAAAQATAEAPGRVYNPLFIYGDTGLGKTHLMHAIAHVVLERDPTARLTLVTTEQFTNELVDAIRERSTHVFKQRYRETDLLLIDDIHFLKRTEAAQEEFFNTFNTLYEAGRQIVVTSDRRPVDIPKLESRLVSRFQWGMVADIAHPDLEHRIAILKHKTASEQLGTAIPDSVLEYIAANIYTNIRELEGAILKVLAYASLRHRSITLELAEEALQSHLEPAKSATVPTSLAHIQQLVAAEWGVTTEGLKSKTRTKTLTVPRHVAMYLARELLGTQLVNIGEAFGGRDHSTVIHGLDRIEETMGKDRDLQARVERVKTQLQYPTVSDNGAKAPHRRHIRPT